MFCGECGIEIPPAWTVVLAKNECPACEGVIMSAAARELFEELRSAMERMPNDPEGLAGWLLSNYRLMKIGDAEPTNFHRKQAFPQGGVTNNGQDEFGNLKIANSPHHVFLKNSGAAKILAQQQSLKAMASNINNAGEEEGPVTIDLNDIDEYDNPDYDPYEAQAAAQMAATQRGSSAKKMLQNNSLVIDGSGPPPTAAELQVITQALGGDMGPVEGMSSQAQQVLNAERMKRLYQQHGVATGSGKGSFSRGGS